MVSLWFSEYLDDEASWQLLVKDPAFIGTTLIAYLYFVLKSGPAFMRNRKPYDLRSVILVYNAFQVLLNGTLVIMALQTIYNSRKINGLWMCVVSDRDTYRMGGYYVANKYLDLVDTAFFVLRKKTSNVSFLHVFHHVVMVAWPALTLNMPLVTDGECIVGATVNGIVHTIMYGYYFGVMWGGRLKPLTQFVKKHITQMQLVQFLLLLVIFGRGAMGKCQYVWLNSAFTFVLNVVFFGLFLQLYVRSYNRKETTKGGKLFTVCAPQHVSQ